MMLSFWRSLKQIACPIPIPTPVVYEGFKTTFLDLLNFSIVVEDKKGFVINVYRQDQPTADLATAVPCWIATQLNLQDTPVRVLFNLSKYLCHTTPDPSCFKTVTLTQRQQWTATCLPWGDNETLCFSKISPVCSPGASCSQRSLETRVKPILSSCTPMVDQVPGGDQNQKKPLQS